jgi:UDP-N-acetylmuramoyl-tripeptide--D-alanyl-D-alanine ligase
MDTRSLRPGDVFVAIRTSRRDGRDFLVDAARAGANSAIVSATDPSIALPQLVVADPLAALQSIAREHRRRFRGPVVGVTGSAGKTSTKDLLALLLGDRVLATEGNLNNHLGVPLTLTRIDPARHAFAVVEAGISAPGEMEALASMIEPDLAIVTLVAPAHLAELDGLAGVAREKALLPAAVRGSGFAVFPESCLAFAPFRELRGRTVVLSKGQGPKSGSRIGFEVAHGESETTVRLSGPAGPETFSLPRVSDGMAQNAALALTSALLLGVRSDDLRARLPGWRPAAMRGELRRMGRQLLYLDCYNANPASMADALAAFSAVAPASEPRLYVIGGMEDLGPEAPRYHRQLGLSLRLRPNDHLCLIGPESDSVRAGALDAGNRPGQIEILSSLDPVAERLSGFAGAVFVKGSRKHALERLVEGTVHA